MYQGILIEIQLLVTSVITGIGLMMFYDIIRVIRIIIPHNSFWMGLEDLFYWVSASLSTFFLLYQKNDGIIRLCIIVAIFLTMWLYNCIFSSFLLKALKKVWKWIRMKLLRMKMW